MNFVWDLYDAGFKKGDVVGCGLIVPPKNKALNGKKAQVFLTVNGKSCESFNHFFFINFKTQDQHVTINENVEEVWPLVGLIKVGTMMEANFGQNLEKPFNYSIWKHPLP